MTNDIEKASDSLDFASLTKWLIVHLRTKWLWVWVLLQSSKLRNSVYFVKDNQNIEGLSIYEIHICIQHKLIFYIFVEKSVKELLNTIEIFSLFTVLKLNLSNCEIFRIGALKGFTVAVCGIKCIDLTKECLKIFGIYYSYQNLQTEKSFLSTIKNGKVIEDVEIAKFNNLTFSTDIANFESCY